MPQNQFKTRLAERITQFGLWLTLSNSFATEVVAGAGYDWLLIDTEHSPGDPITALPQLQTIAGYPKVSAVVRPADNDVVLIKRLLDIGAQSLLIPYVQDAFDAERGVSATRYPPRGVRGVSALTRATRFGREKGYFDHASKDICVVVQIETQKALDNIEAIAAVDGVDALFVGPADLAANLGYGADQAHPEMRSKVIDAVRRIKATHKPAGLLTGDTVLQRMALEVSIDFLALGVDAGLLARSAESLMSSIKNI